MQVSLYVCVCAWGYSTHLFIFVALFSLAISCNRKNVETKVPTIGHLRHKGNNKRRAKEINKVQRIYREHRIKHTAIQYAK